MTEANELGWNMAANLRWLSEQSERPGRVPCGELTGVFLKNCADRLEALAPKPDTTTDGVREALERARKALEDCHDCGGYVSPSVFISIDTALQSPRSCCDAERESPVCQVPPAGWYCTRDAGHDGPCAARPIDPLVNVIRHWLMSEDHPVSKWEIEFATAIRSADHAG